MNTLKKGMRKKKERVNKEKLYENMWDEEEINHKKNEEKKEEENEDEDEEETDTSSWRGRKPTEPVNFQDGRREEEFHHGQEVLQKVSTFVISAQFFL